MNKLSKVPSPILQWLATHERTSDLIGYISAVKEIRWVSATQPAPYASENSVILPDNQW